MHADVHERAEVGDVRDDARTDHARLQIVQLVNVLAVGERDEPVARIAAGLFELVDDVVEREGAELLPQVVRVLHQLDARAQQI